MLPLRDCLSGQLPFMVSKTGWGLGNMAVLFVSHSSKDNIAARDLEAWLRDHGFTDLFIDFSNIVGGEKWAQALRDATGACRVIICLVTENWLASDECFGEFKAAWYLGKPLIPLLLFKSDLPALNDRLSNVLGEYQGFDVTACMNAEGGLDLACDPQIERRLAVGLRAAGALAEIGLDPEAFAIDRTLRPTPFPGLSSFGDDDADAALFYGRSREIAETLEELRKVHAERDLRPLMILGASGAGKSSLLKAGIIPRLRREAPVWLPLHAFRPGADPLLNLSDALARTLADFGKIEASGVIRDRLSDAWRRAERKEHELSLVGTAALEAALEFEGRKLRTAADRANATILISIDQAEEMARAEGDSGEALADYLRAALAATASKWQLVFTIRTDSFSELQSHRRFHNLKARGYDLRVLPVFRFGGVVEEPAKRYGVSVDRALADALMEDAPRQDALPLLAFALQRLWHQYAASGTLTKDNYEKVGGLTGLIEDAAERALHGLGPEQDVPLPSGPPPKHRIDLAASTFVPALVQVNDQGATVRRIAEIGNFTVEQQDLLYQFDRWRLVVRREENNSGTLEVAHEALFRGWARLKGWLEPERARLETLRSLQVDALTWDRNSRDDTFLNHRDKRLAEAVTLADLDAYRKHMGTLEADYLAACQKREQDAKKAEELARTRTRWLRAGIYLLLLGIIAGLIGWINQSVIAEQWHYSTVTRPYARKYVWPYVLSAAKEQTLKPGDSFKECAENCPEMIVVPAGSFMMGSPEGQGQTNEHPQHNVVIREHFGVSKFELTLDEWNACVKGGGCSGYKGVGEYGKGPTTNVSWFDAQQYVTWLSEVSGKTYRLLSEAEYEYAARAGTTTAYPWGDDVKLNDKEMANCDGCGSTYVNTPAPVGSFPPNKFGLYDMVGNVREWTEDCVHSVGYNRAPTDGSAWITVDMSAWLNAGVCDARITRGGSWSDSPDALRSARRTWGANNNRNSNIGFRLARTLAAGAGAITAAPGMR